MTMAMISSNCNVECSLLPVNFIPLQVKNGFKDIFISIVFKKKKIYFTNINNSITTWMKKQVEMLLNSRKYVDGIP